MEYALLLAVLAAACLSAASFLGYSTDRTLGDVRTGLGPGGREFVCSPGRTPAPTPGWEAFWPDIYTCV